MSTPPVTPPDPKTAEPVTPPVAAPLPEGFDALETLPDGKVHVKLATGEEWTGTQTEVMAEMGKGHVNTKRWAQALRDARPPVTATAPVTQTPEEVQQKQLQEYLAEQNAKYLGFDSAQQMRDSLESIQQAAELSQNDRTAMEFHSSCWDFPAGKDVVKNPDGSQTDRNVDKLFLVGANFQIWPTDEQGNPLRPPTARQLAAAHAVAVQQGVYQPLTRDEYQAAMQSSSLPPPSGPTPPPVLTGTQPETVGQPGDAWTMPLDKLKETVLAQQAKR